MTPKSLLAVGAESVGAESRRSHGTPCGVTVAVTPLGHRDSACGVRWCGVTAECGVHTHNSTEIVIRVQTPHAGSWSLQLEVQLQLQLAVMTPKSLLAVRAESVGWQFQLQLSIDSALQRAESVGGTETG